MLIALKPLTRFPADKTVQAIKRLILQENLQPGDALPGEHLLAGALGISRAVVREALSSLVTEGIVAKQAGKRTCILAYDRERMAASLSPSLDQAAVSAQALHEFRAAIEIGAVEYVARRITDEEIAYLHEVVDRLAQKAHQGVIAAQEDRDFHTALLRATHNDFFVQMAPTLMENYNRLLLEEPPSPSHFDARWNLERHRAIVQALASRDLDAARKEMRLHFHLSSADGVV